MPDAGVGAFATVNWLAHRWPVGKRTQPYGDWTIQIGEIEGHRILQATDAAEFDRHPSEGNPVKLALRKWRAIGADVLAARTVREKLHHMFAPLGAAFDRNPQHVGA